MKVYTTRDASRLLGVPPARVRALARAAFTRPWRARRGELRFSFQDLVLLRATKGLFDARVPAQRVRLALGRLAEQLPAGRPLSAVQISARGDRVVVRDGETVWQPDSGQACFNFRVAELAREVAPHARRAVERASSREDELRAEDWYALGCEVEATAADQARDAYRRCLELDPQHLDARVNLGRLLHEAGRNAAAEAQFRLALRLTSADATALFNLGVVVEDQGRLAEAIQIYLQAIDSDPGCADAYYNVARLYERMGDEASALRHLQTYRRLTRDH